MSTFDTGILDIVERDPRFAYEAYEFMFHALHYTQKMLDRLPPEQERRERTPGEKQYHVSGPELLEGIRQFAFEEFGYMARTVFKLWGIHKTGDFGAIVFNLIEAGLMSKTDNDSLADFQDVYDFDEALVRAFRIEMERQDEP
jgi:uncharacterized repeat protein (TIGR04138 family)